MIHREYYIDSFNFQQFDVFSGNMSQSVPNIVLSSRIDTCYECRKQRRGGIFSSKQKSPRSCTLEGFHYITDEHEISFMKEILDQKGKVILSNRS